MNKRPREDEPSSSQKRQFGAGGGYGEQEGYSEERISAQRVADHYSARSNQTLEERENSPIIHLKKLNNWIKSVLVQLYARPGDCVLDLACGKGGDLIKWDKAKVGYYVGVDIAEGSIKDCMTRYNGDSDQQRRKKFSFPARLICADCYETRLDEYLREDAPFDICSCQFAMHYSWSTEARARQALANISALLRPGGTFIGTMPDANVILLIKAERVRQSSGRSHVSFFAMNSSEPVPRDLQRAGTRAGSLGEKKRRKRGSSSERKERKGEASGQKQPDLARAPAAASSPAAAAASASVAPSSAGARRPRSGLGRRSSPSSLGRRSSPSSRTRQEEGSSSRVPCSAGAHRPRSVLGSRSSSLALEPRQEELALE